MSGPDDQWRRPDSTSPSSASGVDGPDVVGGTTVDELRELALAARDIVWETPASSGWDAVVGELESGDPVVQPTRPVPPVAARRRVRRREWVGLAAAAAAVAVVAGAIVMVAGDGGSSDEVLAVAELERLGPAGRGRAEVVERDGGRQLRVEVDDLAAGDDEYFEVWLLDAEVTRFVSLGPVRADGRYDLPDGIDVAELSIVDVSVEPLDGDPAHSGASLLRGMLG